MKTKIGIIISLLVITITMSTIIGKNKNAENLDFILLSSDKFSFSAPSIYFQESDGQIYNTSIIDFDTLFYSSDTILRVIAGPNTQPRGIMQNKSTIKQVFSKIDNLEVDDKITIFEPVIKGRRNVISDCSFLPMIEGKEYFVFLNKIGTYSDNKTFNFSSAIFGKFPAYQNINIIDIVYKDDLIIDYSDLVNSDFVLFDTSQLEIQYNEVLLKEPGNTYYLELLSQLKKYNNYKDKIISVISQVQFDLSGQSPIIKYNSYP